MTNDRSSSRPSVKDIPSDRLLARASTNDHPPWHAATNAIARRFHQICFARTSEVVGKAGLTPLQFAVLIHLNRRTGRPGIDQNGLAARLNIDRNTTSVLVEQLANKGLVERLVDKEDRRARLLSLTVKGEKLYARLQPHNQAVNDAILSTLTRSEREVLISLLIRVIEGNQTVSSNGLSKPKGRRQSLRSVVPPGDSHAGKRRARRSHHEIEETS